jgi:hypothetical protein
MSNQAANVHSSAPRMLSQATPPVRPTTPGSKISSTVFLNRPEKTVQQAPPPVSRTTRRYANHAGPRQLR